MRYLCPTLYYKELARASIRLNMDIDMKDNHQLYVESAAWLGVPYRGTSDPTDPNNGYFHKITSLHFGTPAPLRKASIFLEKVMIC